ncbi:DUF397 domain-containing protein [Streptomyces natalensis]|uniref:DUF397 domain-containing protein n=1 Tax=Streptomyces natalensis ATCC 27448 TaxID=1240678 RepID=A0A0D7CUE1_9ACTN|nr:DUF397 domain-containing protein [Streptomyces natalensis]KIZ19007.1 hypothetical protein SNA_04590 [Streptomyces natalensis ATCC 27448]
MAHGIVWQKSSFSSGGDAPNCVELAATNQTVLLRESDTPHRILAATPSGLAAFIGHIRAGSGARN